MSSNNLESPIRTGDRLVPSRRAAILDLLHHYHSLTVGVLSDHLGVSESTIRRDLDKLQEDGLLERTHGGAIIATPESVFRMPDTIPNLEAKLRIAAAVLKLLEPGDTIALDAGTTTAAVAAYLRDFGPITVVTNDLHIAYELTGCPSVELEVTGGTLRGRFYALLGPLALNTIAAMHTRKAILGLSAISPVAGVTDGSLEAAQIKQAMIRSSDRHIFVADSSKIGRTLLAGVAGIEEIDVFVTDCAAPSDFVAALRSRGVEVILA